MTLIEAQELSLNEGMLASTTIRSAGEADLEQIVNFAYLLELDLQKHDPTRVVPSIEELRGLYLQRLQNKEKGFKYCIFVADKDDKIVGYAIGKAPVDRKPPFYAVSLGNYVDRNYRKQGIGRMLSQKITAFAEEQGADSAVSYVYLGSPGERFVMRNGKTLERVDQSNRLAKYTLRLRPRILH